MNLFRLTYSHKASKRVFGGALGVETRGSANEVSDDEAPGEEKSRKTPVAAATVPFKLRTAARGWSRAGRPSSSWSSSRGAAAAAASSRAGWCTSATGGSGHAQCKHGYTTGARKKHEDVSMWAETSWTSSATKQTVLRLRLETSSIMCLMFY